MRSVLALLGSVLAWRLFKSVSVWQVRRHGARLSNQFPDSLVPRPLRVLPPPESEYVGVWDRSPESARELLVEEYGFEQTFRAYLHAYERAGRTRYEVAAVRTNRRAPLATTNYTSGCFPRLTVGPTSGVTGSAIPTSPRSPTSDRKATIRPRENDGSGSYSTTCRSSKMSGRSDLPLESARWPAERGRISAPMQRDLSYQPNTLL
ncbi:hypothetical protein ACFQH2_02355 [Natronoarchaeum sp. GCM10025703]